MRRPLDSPLLHSKPLSEPQDTPQELHGTSPPEPPFEELEQRLWHTIPEGGGLTPSNDVSSSLLLGGAGISGVRAYR